MDSERTVEKVFTIRISNYIYIYICIYTHIYISISLDIYVYIFMLYIFLYSTVFDPWNLRKHKNAGTF